MEPVKTITGVAVPLDRSDVDTDQIIPAVWLKRVERTGFGEGLFSSWRTNDPDFVLNRPEFQGGSILLAGPNFGIGSSREHAVWALMDAGFKAVVSPGSATFSATTRRSRVSSRSSSPRRRRNCSSRLPPANRVFR